jgi:hypothetical protein
MLSIQSSLSKYQVQKEKKKGSKRGDIVGLFIEALNAERVGTKYPPLKASRVAMMLSVFKTCGELSQFYGSCKDAKNFSSFFFWSLDPKNYK